MIPYRDLKDRTAKFALDVRDLARSMRWSFETQADIQQLLRSSGSIAANYLEADEAESKKDFAHKCKICRKESKESGLWLRLIRKGSFQQGQRIECDRLIQEASEFVLIFSSIIRKTGYEHGLKNT